MNVQRYKSRFHKCKSLRLIHHRTLIAQNTLVFGCYVDLPSTFEVHGL